MSRTLAVLVILAWSFSCFPCSAALSTYNASAGPGLSLDANSNTANVWLVTLTSGNSSQNGDFQGNSAGNGDGNGAGAGSTAWAMYANSGQTARATTTAFNTLTDVSALNQANQYISMDFDNGWIASGSQVGVTFRDGSSNEQFAFRFLGGTSFYQFTDSSNTNSNTSKGFTDDGFNIKLLLTNNSGGYLFTAGSTTITGTLKQLSSTIASLQVFNVNATGTDTSNGPKYDLFFDHLAISTSVPEVSPALAVPVAVFVTGICARIGRRWRRSAAD